MKRWNRWAGLALIAASATAADAGPHGGALGGALGGAFGGPFGGPFGGRPMQGGPMMGGPVAGGPMQGPGGGRPHSGPQQGTGGTQRGPEGGHHGPRGAALAVLRAADADDSRDVTAAEWEAFVAALVVDESGAVSLDDLAAKLPAPPQGWPEDAAVRDEGLVRALDTDGDGVVTVADLQAIYDRASSVPSEPPPPHAALPCGPVRALLRAADTDASRDVSAEEWAAFLDGLGAGEDGVVSLDVLASLLPPPPHGVAEDPTERDEHLVRAFDVDGDGVVTVADLQAIFDRADADADGTAERAEMRPPRPLRGKAHRGAKALARAADADDSRDVTAAEWAAFLDGFVVGEDGGDDGGEDGAVSLDDLAAVLPEPRHGWPADTTERDAGLLRVFDRDGDGLVTKADLQALFDSLDRNQDGALDGSDRKR